MTPKEFASYVEGWAWREDETWRRTAWQTAHIMNRWLKEEDQVTVDDLLVKNEPQEEQTVEQQLKIAEQWVAILGGTDLRKGAK